MIFGIILGVIGTLVAQGCFALWLVRRTFKEFDL